MNHDYEMRNMNFALLKEFESHLAGLQRITSVMMRPVVESFDAIEGGALEGRVSHEEETRQAMLLDAALSCLDQIEIAQNTMGEKLHKLETFYKNQMLPSEAKEEIKNGK